MRVVLSVIMCLMITGCSVLPTPMEMGEMVFVRTLGVDGGGEALLLTASTGQRGQGLQQDVEGSLTLTGEGDSLSGAALQVEAGCDQQVFYGYLDQLLLGEDYCEDGILPVLEYFARDVELGLGSQVWAVAGSASQAIAGGGTQGVTTRLTTLQLEGLQGVAGLSPTAGQLLTDILEQGATYLPRLVDTGGEDGVLISAGYTIIIRDVQCGTLVGEDARGLELLEGAPSGEMVRCDNGVVAHIRKADCAMIPVLVDGKLVGAHIQCDVVANLVEYDAPPTNLEVEAISDQLEAMEEGRISSAIAQLQAMGADAIGLGRQLAMAEPAYGQGILEGWEKEFATLPIWVTVEVAVERS